MRVDYIESRPVSWADLSRCVREWRAPSKAEQRLPLVAITNSLMPTMAAHASRQGSKKHENKVWTARNSAMGRVSDICGCFPRGACTVKIDSWQAKRESLAGLIEILGSYGVLPGFCEPWSRRNRISHCRCPSPPIINGRADLLNLRFEKFKTGLDDFSPFLTTHCRIRPPTSIIVDWRSNRTKVPLFRKVILAYVSFFAKSDSFPKHRFEIR